MMDPIAGSRQPDDWRPDTAVACRRCTWAGRYRLTMPGRMMCPVCQGRIQAILHPPPATSLEIEAITHFARIARKPAACWTPSRLPVPWCWYDFLGWIDGGPVAGQCCVESMDKGRVVWRQAPRGDPYVILAFEEIR